MHRLTTVPILGLALFTLACKSPDSGDSAESSSSASSSSGNGPTTVTPSTGSEPTTTGATEALSTGAGQTTGTASAGQTTGTDATTGDPTTGGGVCVPLQCDGATYACGDCIDNDNDGKVDTADPECVSPCDDLEDTFATGLPGDNMDPCKQDCFFDGNSGGGKGDCAWNLKCDPKSPGGDKCPYDPKAMCPADQTQECVDTCQVPNGCDCFGCCTVSVDGMMYDIFLGDENCSLAAIDTCLQCSKNEDCDDACQPENCEICFGETEPPPGCDMPGCDNADPCKVDNMGNSDCPEGTFCSTGCCVPIVPG